MKKAATHEEAHRRVIRSVWYATAGSMGCAGPSGEDVTRLIRAGVSPKHYGGKPRVTCRRSKLASLGWMFSVRRVDTRYKPARLKEYRANNLYSLFFFAGAEYQGRTVRSKQEDYA